LRRRLRDVAASPPADFFPAELEAALEQTVETLRAPRRRSAVGA